MRTQTLRHSARHDRAPWFRGARPLAWLLLAPAATLLAAAFPSPCAGAWVLSAASQDDPEPQIQAEPEPIEHGRRRFFDGFLAEYVTEHPQHPDELDVIAATVNLVQTEDGYRAPEPGEAHTHTITLSEVYAAGGIWLYDSALAALSPAVVAQLQNLGLIGVYVEPDPDQIAVIDNQIVDFRPDERGVLRFLVTTAIVTELGTIGMGERLPEDERINNPVHRRTIERSPVKPYVPSSREPRADLLDRDAIDDFIFRLNRHPGRRVDAALAASGNEPGGVSLDYLVTENRPWLFFAQVSNTGTDATSDFRERFGFIHNQLTENDDILTIDYLTANFDDVNALFASYDSPIGKSEHWRYKVFGSWYEYTASDVGLPDAKFTGRGWTAGGELSVNFFQHRELFFDLFGGARYEEVRVRDSFANLSGEEGFVLPYVGLRVERSLEESVTYGSLRFEWNLPGVAGTDEPEIDLLGRPNADTYWTTFQADILHAFYLEPLFKKSTDEGSSLAHEIALLGRVQIALDDARLAPNYQEVAGGLYSVRGYPQAIVAGDNLYAGTIEYRYHIPKGMSPNPRPGELFGSPFRWVPQHTYGPVDWDLIVRIFLDAAYVENNDRLSFERNNTLLGTGVGLELQLTRRFNARVDWGVALRDIQDGAGNDIVEAGDNEWYFVITAIF